MDGTHIVLAITLCCNMSRGLHDFTWSIQRRLWMCSEETWLPIHNTVNESLFCSNAFTLNSYFNFIQTVQLSVYLALFLKSYLIMLSELWNVATTPAIAIWIFYLSYFNGLITIIIILAIETGKLTCAWQTDDSLRITRTANWSSFDNVHRLSDVPSPLPVNFPSWCCY